MSQKKVDAYKEEKKNRQQIMKREKMTRRLEALAAAVICIALVAWFSIAVVMHARSSAPAETVTTSLDMTAADEFTAKLDALGTQE